MKSKIKGGYILQPRAINSSDVMKMPPVTRELWFYLCRNVQWTKYKKLNRGQGYFQLKEIQEDLSWMVGYRKEMYSKPQLTKSLRRLREGNMIETVRATHGLLITICNYDLYQDPNNYEGNNEGINEGNAKEMEGSQYKQEGYKKDKKEEESLFAKKEKKPKKKKASTRKRDEYFDAISRIFSIAPTGSGGSQIGRLKKLFNDHGATIEEIERRAENYKKLHPEWEFTGFAVEKHWGALDNVKKKQAKQRGPEVKEQYSQDLMDLEADMSDREQELYFRPIYGFDWMADNSHVEQWEEYGKRFSMTAKDIGAWRRDFSLKNGPFTPERPVPNENPNGEGEPF